MSFRAAFIRSLRTAGVPDGLVLDALLAAEAAERERRAAARAARLAHSAPVAEMNEADSARPVSGLVESGAGPVAVEVESVGGPVKDRARRGLMLAAGLQPAVRAVGAVLVERFNLRTGRCDPGIGDIASKTGLSDRSVRRALAELDARHLIVRVVHGGRRHANAYRPDWEALGRLAGWDRTDRAAAPKMNEADSGVTRTPVAAQPDNRVRQNLQGNIQSSVTPKRSLHPPDRRQGSLLLPIPGRAAVASSSAEARLWRDVQAHFGPQGAQAFEAATLRLMDGGLGERATEAEQSRRGDGLRMVLNVLREAG